MTLLKLVSISAQKTFVLLFDLHARSKSIRTLRLIYAGAKLARLWRTGSDIEDHPAISSRLKST